MDNSFYRFGVVVNELGMFVIVHISNKKTVNDHFNM